MGLGGVFSNLLSLGAQLISAVSASPLAPSSSSSSSPPIESHQMETELKELMRLLERIKALLYDAEEREIRDRSVKLWLNELRGIVYDAEDVLDEYHYQVLQAQVEAREASNSLKSKLTQVSYDMLNQIQQIRSKFAEIAKDRIALQLLEEDGPRHYNNGMQITPTSHFVAESDIIGREWEKKKLIDLLSSESHDREIISVVTIVGTGGIGKTTLAQLVYNDQIIRQKFDKLGWVCLSEDFNVQRLTREVVESITRRSCGLTNLSALQENISEEIRGKRVFLVLDDAWNESRSHWELFRAPFKSASLVKILVTTRNEPVAQIMQTVPTFSLGYMSEEKSWQMFQHYAFGEVIHNMDSNLEKIGKQIMKKCGMLPLAIKSIASLLRHERKEESWREILENELWKSNACNEIFRPLQISYARLPTYLKPCFLYCSMFPRDYRYSARELVQLWIYQGYVQTNELKNAEKIGWEYAKQLWQRSFFEGRYEEKEFNFRLHDMVHDLARCNSGYGCYFNEGVIAPNFSNELYHLYVDHWEEELVEPPPFPSKKFATLRTLIMSHWVKCLPSGFNFSEAQKLRALKLAPSVCLESDFSFVNLKHLRYLSLYGKCFERLPECICSLYNLKNLTLKDCPHLKELPKSIANLVSLEELTIYASDLRALPMSLYELKALRKLHLENCFKFEGFPPNMRNLVSLEELTIMECDNLRMLPLSFCQLKALRELNLSGCCLLEELPLAMGNLTNLQFLRVLDTNVSSLPPSLNKIIRTLALEVGLYCRTIGWLEHFADLEGTLILSGLSRVSSLKDVSCANLASMHHLQRLILTWVDDHIFHIWDKNVLQLCIDGDGDASSKIDLDDQPSSLMVCLQPHPNLKELKIEEYPGLTFPDWIGNPTLCASLTSIELVRCELITCLPFGNLDKLKYLKIEKCYNLQFIHEKSLPLILEEIEISHCRGLISVTGLRFKSLVKLEIVGCRELHLLDCYWDPETCVTIVSRCPKLREWCSQHGIYYEGSKSDDDAGSNLHELKIKDYLGHIFPDWIGNPTMCVSLESIELIQCKFITYLPFGSLDKLKNLRISGCSSLQFIHEDCLPLVLEEIEISHCQSLISVTGIQRLKFLVKLEVTVCMELCFLDRCRDMEMCTITVSWCPKLREWCSQHDIDYDEGAELDECGAKLLPDVSEYSLEAYSFWSVRVQYHQIIVKLKQLLNLLHSRIWTMLCNENMRKIKDDSVELWLKELCNLWYCTDHVSVMYIDEVLQEQVKATDASTPISHIRGLIEVVDGKLINQIQVTQQIRSKFDEKDQALQLLEEDIVLYVLRPCGILIDRCNESKVMK